MIRTGILSALREKRRYEDFGRGASDEEIANLETTFEVTLPMDYRDFLSSVGYVSVFGRAIFGISDLEENSASFWTSRCREINLPKDFAPYPENALVISDYGGGGYYFLFCDQSARSGQVILILDENFNGEEQSWENFWEFVEQDFL